VDLLEAAVEGLVVVVGRDHQEEEEEEVAVAAISVGICQLTRLVWRVIDR
jgi:hypothetical protein